MLNEKIIELLKNGKARVIYETISNHYDGFKSEKIITQKIGDFYLVKKIEADLNMKQLKMFRKAYKKQIRIYYSDNFIEILNLEENEDSKEVLKIFIKAIKNFKSDKKYADEADVLKKLFGLYDIGLSYVKIKEETNFYIKPRAKLKNSETIFKFYLILFMYFNIRVSYDDRIDISKFVKYFKKNIIEKNEKQIHEDEDVNRINDKILVINDINLKFLKNGKDFVFLFIGDKKEYVLYNEKKLFVLYKENNVLNFVIYNSLSEYLINLIITNKKIYKSGLSLAFFYVYNIKTDDEFISQIINHIVHKDLDKKFKEIAQKILKTKSFFVANQNYILVSYKNSTKIKELHINAPLKNYRKYISGDLNFKWFKFFMSKTDKNTAISIYEFFNITCNK